MWYALHNRLVEEKDIKDGWKLQKQAYNSAIEALDKTDIPSGRVPLRTDTDVFIYDKEGNITGVSRPEVIHSILENQRFITLMDTKEIYYYNQGVYRPNGAPVFEQHMIS